MTVGQIESAGYEVRSFVGRHGELERIETAARNAFAGLGVLELIAGEPGIGKSWLAEQAARRAEALGARVLRGRCWDAGGAPAFWPWIQIVRALGEGTLPAGLEAFRTIGHQTDPGNDQARTELFEEVLAGFRKIARAKPLVCVFDDLHAADVPSLQLLYAFTDELSVSNVLVIGTYRDVETNAEPEVERLIGELARKGRVLRLGGLHQDEVGLLVRQRFPSASVQTLSEALWRRSAGNPFFLEELLAIVPDADHLDERAIAAFPVPEHVRELIERRLSEMPESSRRLLSIAAAIGPELDAALVSDVSGDGPDDVSSGLRVAEAARILSATRDDAGRFAFTHDLFREVLYQSLPASRRVGMHKAIGEALERRRDSTHPFLADLAWHFLRAVPGGTRSKALHYCDQAGRQAMEQLAYESALRHFEDALATAELVPEEPAERRADLLLRIGEAMWALGEFQDSKRAFRRAAKLAEASSPETLARAALGTLGHSVFLDLGAGGVDEPRIGLLSRALEALPVGDTPIRARVTARLAAALSLTSHWNRRDALASEAVAMARRLGDPGLLADVLHAASWATWGPEALEERLSVSEEVLSLAARASRFGVAILTRNRRFHLFLEAGDRGAAVREMEASKSLAASMPQRFYEWMTMQQEAVWATVIGQLDEAERVAEAALRLGQENQNPNAIRLYGIHNVFVRRERGSLEEVVELVESVVSTAPDFSAWRSALAWTYVELGRDDDARRELAHLSKSRFATIDRNLYWLSCLWGCAEVCVRLEDRDTSRAVYELLSPFADRCMVVYAGAFGGSIARSLGSLAAVLGRHDEAERHFETATSQHQKMGALTWQANSDFDHARALIRRGLPGVGPRVESLLSRASTAARRLGLRALESRVAGLERSLRS